MSESLDDANEFDKIVKKKSYRIKFLESFVQGWKSYATFSPAKISQRCGFLLGYITEYDFAIVEEKYMEEFGFCFGLLIGTLRFAPDAVFFISDRLVEVIMALKQNENYKPYYNTLRKMILNHWYKKINVERLMPYQKGYLESIINALN